MTIDSDCIDTKLKVSVGSSIKRRGRRKCNWLWTVRAAATQRENQFTSRLVLMVQRNL